MSETRYEIVVHQGDFKVSRHVLGPGEYFAGTSATCAVPIPIDVPGRKFTRISISKDGRVLLEDLESENGTMLDGLPIVIATWQPGHLVRFGDVSLELWPVTDERKLSDPATVAPVSGGTPAVSAESMAPAPSTQLEQEEAPVALAPAPLPPQAPAEAAPAWRDLADAEKEARARRGGSRRLLLILSIAAAVAGVGYLQLQGGRNALLGAGHGNSTDLATSFYHEARQLVERGRYAEALEKIRPAIEIDGSSAEYHYLEGNILESQFRLAEALSAYERALTRNPNHLHAQQNRDLCTELMREAPAGLGDNPTARQRLAKLMTAQGRESEAAAMNGP